MARHIIHLAMTAGCQPRVEVAFGPGQAGLADTYRGEAQFHRPATDVGDQPVERSAAIR